jgi:hypothetical protein
MILQLTKTAAQFCIYASKVKHKHYSKENLSRNKVILPLHYSKENLSRNKVILPLPSSLKFDLSLLVQLTVFIDLLTSFNVHQEHKGNVNGEFICMPWIEL